MTNPDQTPSDNNTTNELTCKNCGTTFIGRYCPNCGQHIKEIERPIRFMIADFMGTVVSFDTRLLKTLGAVLYKPGKLTQDFLEGKRARYMPPFRFYVFISFVMFLLISIITNNSIKKNKNSTVNVNLQDEELVVLTDSSELRDSIIQDVDKKLSTHLDSTQYETYKAMIADNDSTQEAFAAIVNNMDNIDRLIEKSDSKYVTTIKLIKEHPEIYMNKLFKYISWSLFLFMPVFAFFLWISFFRSKKLYVGHLIFALNIHSFIFTVTSIVVALALIFPDQNTQWAGYLFLLIPAYQIIGARRLYQRKWLNIFFKLTLVWFLYSLILLIGLILLFVFTFIGL